MTPAEYNKQIVQAHLTNRDVLEQLAEEADEVGQAALKLIRAKHLSLNPTPKDAYEVEVELFEEVSDLLMNMSLLYPKNWKKLIDKAESSHKWMRWANRILSEENRRRRVDARFDSMGGK